MILEEALIFFKALMEELARWKLVKDSTEKSKGKITWTLEEK